MYLYVSPIWKAPKWHHCFLFESNTIGSIPVFSLWCLWLPSLMVRSLPLLFSMSASFTSLSAYTDSLQRCCAPISRQHKLSEPGEQGMLKQTQTSFLLTKGFPSWVFPSLDVRRMIKKKKVPRGHMQRKDCRHTLTNILLPAFYWILCGVGGRYENCWCAVSLGLPYIGLEKIPQFLPFCDYMCCWCREQGEQNLEVGFLSSSVTPSSWPLEARALDDLLKPTGWQALRVCCMAAPGQGAFSQAELGEALE